MGTTVVKTPSRGAAEDTPAHRDPKELEAYRILLSQAERKTGKVPGSSIVWLVLHATRGGDWPVQRAAMAAVLRRFTSARQDRLRIASRPPRGTLYGAYGTRRHGSSRRPYATVLEEIDPILGSCDCPDFSRASLGICKHLIAVLENVASRPRRLERARKEQAQRRLGPRPPRLRLDPIRPLLGRGDWLEQVVWIEGAGGRRARIPPFVEKRFRKRGDRRALVNTYPDRPARRLSLVRSLARLALQTARRKGALPADPALLALLREERRELERLARDRTACRNLDATLRTLKQQLFAYQRTGVERFLARGRLVLADDMGLGKTAQAIACCHVLWRRRKVQRGLLVVPASLKTQWEREWRLFSSTPVEIVNGPPGEREATYRARRRGFLIVNYEQVIRDLPVIHHWKADMIVLDEAQRIKNWATKSATFIKRLRPPYRLVLTGTPMENRLDELASILEWVDDRALEPKWRLVPWHSAYADGKREVEGARNLTTLRARISHCLVRRIRSEVLRQLPKRKDTTVPVEMTSEQSEAHSVLDASIARLLGISRNRPLTQPEFLRLMQLLTTQRIICNGMAQLDFEEVWEGLPQGTRRSEAVLRSLASPKLLEFRNLFREIVVHQERKAVVFSQWRRMLMLARWAVADILAQHRLRSAFFTGHEGQKRRTQNIVEFHDDRDMRALFSSDAGGVGLNLQRAATCCVNLELPWNPAVLEQRVGRIYRIGQRQPIDVYNLVTHEGIEARIFTLVGDKRQLFTGLFDGESDEIRFERSGSFLARLERIIEPVEVPELDGGPGDGAREEDPSEREAEKLVAAADETADSTKDDGRDPSGGEPSGGEQHSLPSAGEVRSLFSKLEVTPQQDGGVTIRADAASASTLATLFEGMAKLLEEARQRSSP